MHRRMLSPAVELLHHPTQPAAPEHAIASAAPAASSKSPLHLLATGSKNVVTSSIKSHLIRRSLPYLCPQLTFSPSSRFRFGKNGVTSNGAFSDADSRRTGLFLSISIRSD